jgi:hypothetical protein
MNRCNVLNSPTVWEELVELEKRGKKNKSLKANICRLVLNATMYNIWRNLNELKYGNHPKTEEQLM